MLFTAPPRALRPLALAARLFVLGSPAIVLTTAPASAAENAAVQHYAIVAGSLSEQLNQFARQSGIDLAADAALTQGLNGKALNGDYDVESGLATLLQSHGLQAVKQADGSFLLQKAPTEDELVVVAQVNHQGMTEGTGSYTTDSMSAATGLALSPRETPQSVSVVTRQRMNEQNMTSLDEAMSQTTGVNVVNQSSYQVKFQSRGFSMDNVKEDGVSSSFQNSIADMGAAEASSESPDLAIYDHVEVLRGASGLTQGSGEPGGTVNLVRKKPTYNFQGYVSAGAGSWDNYRNEVDVSGPLNDDASVRGRFVGVFQDKQSSVDYVDSERRVLYGTLAWDLTPDTTLTTGINWQKTHTVPDLYGLPMATDYSSLGLPRSTFLGASWNRITFEKLNTFAELEHHFDNDWSLKSALNYTHSDAEGKFVGMFGNGTKGVDSSGNAVLNNAQQRHNRSNQWGYNLSLSGPFELFGRHHELLIGGDYQKENFDNRFGTVSPLNTAVNIYSWQPDALDEPNWPDYASRYKYNLYRRGLFATTRLELADDWKLILGGRYSSYNYDYYYPSSNGRLHVHDQFTPYGGLLWNFAPDYTWYLSYADIYQPQSEKDRNQNILPAITGTNYETGIKGEFFDGDLNASLALFRIIQSNRAMDDPSCDESGDSCSVANGKVRSQGVEMEVSGKLADGWQVFTGYTLTNTKYLKAAEGTEGTNYSTYTPQHMFKLYSSYTLPGSLNKWTIGAGMTTQSDTNTRYLVHQGGYTLFNANVSYQYNKHLSFNLVGNNLTDKEYYRTLNNRHRGGYNYYGDPRNFMLTAKWDF
ncbi:TonB-dependent siderophore receptor [Lonsdalea quercina]|uniref:TonB-dependent siderophore receptor n=1 Tax=Lonsdalea quercina TaxID=71657 RepID=UPI0039764C84